MASKVRGLALALVIGAAACSSPARTAPCPAAVPAEGAPCVPPASRKARRARTHALGCMWADKVCACETCGRSDGTTSAFVHCRSRSDVAPGCPALRPLLGTPCTSEGLSCNDGECCTISLVPSEQCTDGSWHYEETCDGAACALPTCPSRQAPPIPASPVRRAGGPSASMVNRPA